MGSGDLCPSLPVACKPLSQAGKKKTTSKWQISHSVHNGAAEPRCKIHRALPVRALQPVIILKATIKTIETHVMGLGRIAWLIPTSIPEERKPGVPRVLLLCRAGGDRKDLQGIELSEGRWQQPGPQAGWHPRSHPGGSDQAGGAAGGFPLSPHPTSTLPRVTQKVRDKKSPSSKPVV